MKFDLIICIVPRNKVDVLSASAIEAGATGGTVAFGRGTASNSIIQMLGFGDSAKELLYIVSKKEATKKIIDAINEKCLSFKKPFGILFSIELSNFMRLGNVENETSESKTVPTPSMAEKEKKMETTHKLVTIIVQRGFAEDAIDAARKAGATGGTVINAHGTAKPGDAKFFGMEIVPEKDMLLILCENEKENAILDAVKNLPCLEKKGSGIAFSSDAKNFLVLGK